MYTSLLSNVYKIVIHTALSDPSLHVFSLCFLVNKSAFRYIVLFGNCMDPLHILSCAFLRFGLSMDRWKSVDNAKMVEIDLRRDVPGQDWFWAEMTPSHFGVVIIFISSPFKGIKHLFTIFNFLGSKIS